MFTRVHDCFHDLFCMNFKCKKQWITAHQVWVGFFSFFFPLCVFVCVCVYVRMFAFHLCFVVFSCCFLVDFFVLCVRMGVEGMLLFLLFVCLT